MALKQIEVLGNKLYINTNNISALTPELRADNKYNPIISLLPGIDLKVTITGAPFDTYDECLNALKALVEIGE